MLKQDYIKIIKMYYDLNELKNSNDLENKYSL